MAFLVEITSLISQIQYSTSSETFTADDQKTINTRFELHDGHFWQGIVLVGVYVGLASPLLSCCQILFFSHLSQGGGIGGVFFVTAPSAAAIRHASQCIWRTQ